MSWRIGHEHEITSCRTSKARKLRRKANAVTKIAMDTVEDHVFTGTDRVRLRSSLSRLAVPYSKPTKTKLGKKLGTLEHGLRANYGELPDLLFGLEDEAVHRMGNRTVYDPERLKQAIDVFGKTNYTPHMRTLDQVTDDMKKRLKKLRASPVDSLTALQVMLVREKNTSSGFPWVAKRYAVAYKYLPEAWHAQNPAASKVAKEASEGIGIDLDPLVASKSKRTPVYIANYRTEAGVDGDFKTRLVWSAPLGHQIRESRYAIPIQEKLKVDDAVVDERLGAMFMYSSEYRQMQILRNYIGYAQENGLDLVSADYSSFDATISADLIARAFDILGIPEVAPQFIHKKLLTPWGTFEFESGVPSGSPFTNIIDSVVNAMVLNYVAKTEGVEVECRVNGDDSVAIFSQELPKTTISERALELGIEMNPSKQAQSRESCTFNRQYWGLEYDGPVPSINRTLNSLIFLDQPFNLVGMKDTDECMRAVQILIRLESHPMKNVLLDTMKDILKGDIHLLDYRKLLAGSATIPVAGGTPISSAEYVKYLDGTFLARIYDRR
jgi:hypothetical protein